MILENGRYQIQFILLWSTAAFVLALVWHIFHNFKTLGSCRAGLHLKDVSFAFRQTPLLKRVSLNLDISKRTVLIGRNGSGKSTFLKLLNGEFNTSEGSIDSSYRDVMLMSQETVDWEDFTARAHLHIFASLFSRKLSEFTELIEALNLNEYLDKPAAALSGGTRRRLFLLYCMMRRADLFLFDEPTASVDVKQRKVMWRIIIGLSKTSGILVSSHHRDEINALSERKLFLQKGSMRVEEFNEERLLMNVDSALLSKEYPVVLDSGKESFLPLLKLCCERNLPWSISPGSDRLCHTQDTVYQLFNGYVKPSSRNYTFTPDFGPKITFKPSSSIDQIIEIIVKNLRLIWKSKLLSINIIGCIIFPPFNPDLVVTVRKFQLPPVDSTLTTFQIHNNTEPIAFVMMQMLVTYPMFVSLSILPVFAREIQSGAYHVVQLAVHKNVNYIAHFLTLFIPTLASAFASMKCFFIEVSRKGVLETLVFIILGVLYSLFNSTIGMCIGLQKRYIATAFFLYLAVVIATMTLISQDLAGQEVHPAWLVHPYAAFMLTVRQLFYGQVSPLYIGVVMSQLVVGTSLAFFYVSRKVGFRISRSRDDSVAADTRTTDSSALAFDHVSFGYGKKEDVVQDVSFSVNRKERLLIVGQNGAGKTTLLKLVQGNLSPKSGSIRRNISVISYCSQQFSLWNDLTPLQILGFFLRLRHQIVAGKEEEYLKEQLDLVGLDQSMDVPFKKLSGGQKRMVSLAAALVGEPDLLALDEPFAGVDQETKKNMLSVLKSRNIACLLVSHEIDQRILDFCEKMMVFDRRVQSLGTVKEVIQEVNYLKVIVTVRHLSQESFACFTLDRFTCSVCQIESVFVADYERQLQFDEISETVSWASNLAAKDDRIVTWKISYLDELH